MREFARIVAHGIELGSSKGNWIGLEVIHSYSACTITGGGDSTGLTLRALCLSLGRCSFLFLLHIGIIAHMYKKDADVTVFLYHYHFIFSFACCVYMFINMFHFRWVHYLLINNPINPLFFPL